MLTQTIKPTKEQLRKQLDEDMRAFLAKGGKVDDSLPGPCDPTDPRLMTKEQKDLTLERINNPLPV